MRCSSSSSETTRRACKRLRRSILQRVQTAHSKCCARFSICFVAYFFLTDANTAEIVQDNTEIAFFYLHEMVNATTKQRGGLSKAKLRGLLAEYGPIRVNTVVSSGSLFLVEICRARHLRETTMLACVKELVETHGALVNLVTYESASSRQSALTVAAARGMSSVVKYLLSQGANPHMTCTGRFRLTQQQQQQQRASVYRQDATPCEFAQAMRDAQVGAAATREVLNSLDACIRLLQQAAANVAKP